MVKIWEQDLRQRLSGSLSPIIPMVIYHGIAKWNIDEEFISLLKCPEELINRRFECSVFRRGLGFVLLATFYKAGPHLKKHGFLIMIALCFSVSLFIEIAQAWMPSRSSDFLDLMLNTLGALLGARSYRYFFVSRRI